MKKFRKHMIVLISIMLLTTVALAGCGTNNEAQTKGELKIALNNWAENIAVSNMWKVLLEEKGYSVKLMSMDKAPVWVATADGSVDFAPEVWLPSTDKPLYDKYKDDIVLQDPWYEGTGLGLVVPKYVNINSIEELNANKDQFDGKIVGIDPGASLTRMTNDVIDQYGLDFKQITSSGPAMMSELDRAYNKQEPIVVALWNPHWAFAEYDLKYLDDPKNVYGDAENIYFMSRKGFGDDYPEVLKWLNTWQMDDDSLGSLMSVINEKGDAYKGAQEWVKNNRDLVDGWMK